MPAFTERLRDFAINTIGGQSYRQRQERTADLLERAYRQGPALVPTATLLRQLGEIDPQLLDIFMRQRGYQVIHGRFIGSFNLTEQDRVRAVEQSRIAYHTDVQYENAVTSWTDFGFGQQVQIVPMDDAAKEVWDECWTARRNAPLFKQRKLHMLSNDLVKDGEIFFVAWASTVDGSVTWRRYATDDVAEIIYDNEDTDVPLFYRCQTDKGDVYFPDWQAQQKDLDQEWTRITKANPQAKRADDIGQEVEIGGQQIKATVAVMLQAAQNPINGRGWPKFYRGIEWMTSLRQHIGDHLTVAKAVATFVDEVITKSGSRGVDAIAAKFASTLTSASGWQERNPSPAAGSVLTHNDALSVERRPLTTGAGDAQTTAGLVVSQASASTKIPPHYMGFTQMLQNRAVARETNRPFIEQMERYQEFWADVFHDMVQITLMFAERYNKRYSAGFETTEVEVSFESPLLIPVDEIAAAIKAITDSVSAGVADPAAAQRAVDWLVAMTLVSLGARNVARILEPEEGEESAPEKRGPEVPEGPAEMAERITAVLRANAEEGSTDWQSVAEWALDEVVAGGNGRK